jgi:glycosyltransferase involved in cell wall biosynthesis
MNILHIIHRYNPAIGGAEKYMQELSEEFAAHGSNVSIYTTNARDIEYFFNPSLGHPVDSPLIEILNGVNVHRYKIAHFPLRNQLLRILSLLPSWRLKCLFEPYQMFVPGLYLKSYKPHNIDIVHASSSPFTPMLFSAYMLAKKNNVPFVITPFLHIGNVADGKIAREHIRHYQIRLWQKADAIIVNTETEKEFIIKQGITSERIHLVGVGINPAHYLGGEGKRFKEKYNIQPGEQIIAHIARWDINKGTFQLLEAFQILLQQNRNIRLVLLGSPTLAFKTFWQNVTDSVKQKIILIEHASDQQKNDLLDAMDLFVMPSRVESFGIVYFESWLYKKPVIGADIPAIREIINDSKDGYLVPFGDSKTLADKILSLLNDHNLSVRFGETGYQKTIAKYNFHQKYLAVQSLYNSLIEKSNPSKNSSLTTDN